MQLHEAMKTVISDTQALLLSTYEYLLPFALVLLGAIFVPYVFIWSDQKIHGRTCCMFTFCNFMYFLTLTFEVFLVFETRTISCLINGKVYGNRLKKWLKLLAKFLLSSESRRSALLIAEHVLLDGYHEF